MSDVNDALIVGRMSSVASYVVSVIQTELTILVLWLGHARTNLGSEIAQLKPQTVDEFARTRERRPCLRDLT